MSLYSDACTAAGKMLQPFITLKAKTNRMLKKRL
jgi:hypothetical protein